MPYKLREMRKKREMSQEDLSKAANVSRQTIVNLESGELVNTTAATLRKLAEALDCSVSDIFCA